MSADVPLLLDTDIGSNVDDAVCLAYLLRQRRCELLGITTVTGDTAKRATLADAICREAGRPSMPIHAGASGPLLIGPGQPHVPQFEAIASRPHRTHFLPNTAIEFMRDTIRARPREVTLLGIGPLTNIALLFAADPEIPALLKGMVLMCGVFSPNIIHRGESREWNARVDPIATAIVFRSRPPSFISVGLDVTLRCKMSAAECRRKFTAAGRELKIVSEMAEVWFRECPEITFHDLLAAAVIFEPQLCDFTSGEVTVEFTNEQTAGRTLFQQNESKPVHQIATGVEPSRFFDHCFQVIGSE